MPSIITFNTNIAFKRGTTVKNNGYIGAAGTISIDTDRDEIRIHDGFTAGGIVANSNPVTTSKNGLMIATDKVKLDKLTFDGNNQVSASLIPVSVTSGFIFKGNWNASTNNPAIPTATASNKNWYYKCTVAGTSTVTGSSKAFIIGDWLISNGSSWLYLSGTDVSDSLCTILNALSVTNNLILINNYLL